MRSQCVPRVHNETNTPIWANARRTPVTNCDSHGELLTGLPFGEKRGSRAHTPIVWWLCSGAWKRSGVCKRH